LNTTPTAALNLPISLLVCPGRQLLVPNPFPVAPVTFVGWGGIRGMDSWSEDPALQRMRTRDTLLGVSRIAALLHGHRLVIGCERRTAWLKDHPERSKPIDTLLHAIYWGMKAVHGADTEVAFSGPEDAIVGDFTTPMLNGRAEWNAAWTNRHPMPFTSPRYGATPLGVAANLWSIAMTTGLSRGVVLWMQETDPAAQQGVIEFGLAVDKEYGRIK
jgi:hypothetical protein